MSNGDNNMMESAYRVLSLRIDEGLRAQLEVLAQLNERSMTEECRIGLEQWVTNAKTDPTILSRAEQVRAEIERDAQTKRDAIVAVLGSATSAAATPITPTAPATPAGSAKPGPGTRSTKPDDSLV